MIPTHSALPPRARLKSTCACFLVLAGALLLGGCIVTSVYPFYDAKTLVSEPALLGDWVVVQESGQSDEHWIFETEGTNQLKVIYTSGDETNIMIGHTFMLENHLFLDLMTGDMKDKEQPPPIPSHLLFRFIGRAPHPRMVQINYEWLVEWLSTRPDDLRHHLVKTEENEDKPRLVLTADPADLQKFILKHLGTEKAWSEEMKLGRPAAGVKAEASAPK